MSLLRKVRNIFYRFDQNVYTPQGLEEREGNSQVNSTSTCSLPSNPTYNEELGIGSLVTEDIARIFNVEPEEVRGVSIEHLYNFWRYHERI